MERFTLRVIYSGAFTPETLRATGRIPAGYEVVENGTDKEPGRIGEGFGGEALVCLLDGDNGDWFEALVKELRPDWDVTCSG